MAVPKKKVFKKYKNFRLLKNKNLFKLKKNKLNFFKNFI